MDGQVLTARGVPWRRRDLLLPALSLQLARAAADGGDAVVAVLLRGALTLLRVGVADLYLPEATVRVTDPGHRLARTAGTPLDPADPTGPRTVAPPVWVLDPAAAPHPVVGQAVRVPRADALSRHLLARSGLRQALLIRIPVPGQDPVMLLVGDRAGARGRRARVAGRRGFAPRDLALLEALAEHAGAALTAGRRLDRLRREVEQAAYQAQHDPLTGLVDRQQFLAELAAELGRRDAVGVVEVDVAHFQDVNDALGHTMGDALLREVGGRLQESTRDCLAARLGADLFAVMVRTRPDGPGVDERVEETVRALIDRLDEEFTPAGFPLHVEFSMGSAVAPQDASDPAGLLQLADVAMHRAKDGRRAYQAFSPAFDRSSAQRLALFADLRRAVVDGSVEIALQPLVRPATGAVVGAEALARWRREGHGPVRPDAFVPLAERGGLIVPLTELVLRRALRELAAARDVGLPSVSVNLSSRLLLDSQIDRVVAAALERAGLPPQGLVLEVTETAVMADTDTAVSRLKDLRDLGVRLAVDDYGTGQSSLAYLKRLPVHEIKIDRAFVTHMATDRTDAAIVRSTIELAHELGFEVVAEGVEDEATLALLAELGCDLAQGYHVSPPLAPEALREWLGGRVPSPQAAAPGTPVPSPRSADGGAVRASTG